VLGLELGDKVALDADSFQRLAKAFFVEIEARYTSAAPPRAATPAASSRMAIS
jgi:hypothetical protein